MSSASPHQLKCPECGHEQETTVWGSINVAVSPELKECLMKGTINTFSCEKCGNQAFIAAPLLYHDMTNRFCVQYYPPQALEDGEFYEQFSDRGELAEGVNLPKGMGASYLFRPHIVFDINEMLRYITFRDRLGACAGFITDPDAKDEAPAGTLGNEEAPGAGKPIASQAASATETNPQ